ncbi:MAG: DUF1573 domain-containing protein [Gemmataceae bacterium]|nr:DUF1573 domain-containing protein [Gemmataceae bacterium]MDW8266006.1 DUF1573 domain-containing protein [Gemmataceae bacterium]
MPKRTCFCLLALLAASPVRAEPQFSARHVDVGEVRTGTALTPSFTFVNPGPASVTLLDARASCGCLVPRVERRTYQPGESGSVRLEINTLTQPAGPNTWTLVLRFEEGGQVRETTLTLAARLVTEVQVQPASLHIYADKGVCHEIRVTDLRDQSLRVTAADSSSPWVAAAVEPPPPTRGDRPTWVIRLTVRDDLPPGRHEERVTVYTDDPAYRTLNVPVTIIKKPRHNVSALPGEVTWSVPRGQPVPSRIVLIRAADRQAVKVAEVTSDDPAITATWAEGPHDMSTVRLHVDRSRVRGGEVRTTVRVRLRQPMAEVVEIPVTFRSE